MIPLYTHFLSPEDYGTLEILDLVSYLVGLFLAMGIAQSLFRFYYEFEEQEKRDQVISVSMITLWGVTIVILISLLYFSRGISTLVFNSNEYFRMLNLVFIALVLNLNSEVPLGVLRIKQKSVQYVTINIIRLIFSLGLNILFIVKYGMGVIGILYSGLIVSFLTCLYVTFYILRRIKLTYSFSLISAIFKYALPIMWSWLGMFILHFGDRFIIQRLLSLSDVGIYSLAYKFGYMPNYLILYPFMMIWSPKRFDLLKEPNAKDIYSTIFTYFMFAQIFAGLGVIVLIKDVIALMSASQFHEAYKYVPVILLGYICFGIFEYVQFGIHVSKKTRVLAIFTLITAGINVGLNLLLMPILGLWAAALITFFSWAFLTVCIYFPSQKHYHIPYEFIRLSKMVGTAVILYIFAYLVNPSSMVISIILKFFIASLFPFVLYLIKFYKPNELAKIFEIKRYIYDFWKNKRGSILSEAKNIIFRRNKRIK